MATKIGGDPLLKVKSNKNLIPQTSESKGLGKSNNAKNIIEGDYKRPVDKTLKRNNDPKVSSKPSSDEISNNIGVSSTLINAIDPNIKGGGIDSRGRFRTPKGQLIDAITKADDPSDARPIEVISDELNTAKDFDNELSFEQQKAQILTSYTQPTVDTPEPVLYVDDIENETNQAISGINEGDPSGNQNLANVLRSYKGKPVKYGEAAIERLGLEEYYPDINTPLQVGTYSGSIVGNNPIFVGGGGYFPFSILDARKRAMETAAANRVAQAEKVKELFIVPTAEQYQDQLTEYGLDIYNKYGEATGWDYNAITDMSTEVGRQFTRENQNYRSNAKRFLAIQSQYDTALEQWNRGDGAYIPESALETMQAWQSGAYDIEYLMTHPEEMQKIERDMITYDNMTKDGQKLKEVMDYDISYMPDPSKTYTEDELARFQNEITTVLDHSNYDVLRTTKFEFIPMDRIIEAVNHEVENGMYYGDKEQVKSDMTAYVTSLIATKWQDSYMEAANRSTNVSVRVGDDNPEKYSWIKDVVNNSNKAEFKQDLNKALSVGGDNKAYIDNAFGKHMGIEPDSSTENIDGIVPLGNDMNRTDSVPVTKLEVQDENGNWVNFQDWQVNTVTSKYGLSEVQANDYKKMIYNQGATEEQVQAYLVKAGVPLNEAILFSKNSNSVVSGGLSERRVTMAYDDENGNRQYMTYDSDPSDSSYAYVHDYYDVFTDGGTLSGLKVRAGYNPNFTTTAAVIDSTTSGTSSGLERIDKHGGATSTNTGNVTTTPAAPAPKAPIKL